MGIVVREGEWPQVYSDWGFLNLVHRPESFFFRSRSYLRWFGLLNWQCKALTSKMKSAIQESAAHLVRPHWGKATCSLLHKARIHIPHPSFGHQKRGRVFSLLSRQGSPRLIQKWLEKNRNALGKEGRTRRKALKQKKEDSQVECEEHKMNEIFLS